MSYFTDLVNASKELDKLAAPYCENRPDWSLEDIAGENCKLAWKWVKDNNIDLDKAEDWDKMPEIIANIVDGWVPFSSPSNNGSLNYTLGLSLVSLEAHAWALYDYLSGKTQSCELPFELVAKI